MNTLDLLEHFHKKHQGAYSLEALSQLILDAFYLGARQHLPAIQRVRELAEEWVAYDSYEPEMRRAGKDILKALNGEIGSV